MTVVKILAAFLIGSTVALVLPEKVVQIVTLSLIVFMFLERGPGSKP